MKRFRNEPIIEKRSNVISISWSGLSMNAEIMILYTCYGLAIRDNITISVN